MAIDNRYSGTLRTDYETDRARLDNFPAVESDWREVLCRLEKASGNIRYGEGDRVGTLEGLYANQVLTVLVEMLQEEIPTATDALQKKLCGWIARLDSYLNLNWKAGSSDGSATQAARLIKEQLQKSLPTENETHEQDYYRMLRAINNIRQHANYYLEQIENSGDMDGALALLLTYIKNYCHIAHDFNERLASLPELYRKQVLQVRTAAAVQDNVYVVVTPKEGATGFTLPQGQLFSGGQNAAGEDLLYKTIQKEYISPAQCAEVNAVSIIRTGGKATGIRKQSVPFRDMTIPAALFSEKNSASLPLGWQLESSMLILDEGERNVSIRFRLSAETPIPVPANLPTHSFTLLLSGEKGWTEQVHTCRIDTNNDGVPHLYFDFKMMQGAAAPTPCIEEVHGTTTLHPALRLLTNAKDCPYDWASGLTFDAVEIHTAVSGIQNFTFYNELGEVDTTQPFYPFGPQAEKGAWFMFGNQEIGHKPLEEVRLKGLWKKLPETEADFEKIYRGYAGAEIIGIGSFTIDTEYQEDSRWNDCKKEQPLFVAKQGDKSPLEHAEVVFKFSDHPLKKNRRLRAMNAEDPDPEPYEYDRDRDGFFRTTLQAPSIGFGTEAYRTLFTETMIYNSRCKEKKRKNLPVAPIVPMLADAELSYIACEETKLVTMKDSSITLTRITALSEQETFPIGKERTQPFLPTAPTDHLLYIAFLHATGEQTVRMYLDMVLPQEKIPFYNPQPDKTVKLAWAYWNGTGWLPISTESVIAEETCGLTQSGFVEIKLLKKISEMQTDRQGRVWLRAAATGDVSSCLAVRNIWTNCIRIKAQNSDGTPLPAGTIQSIIEPDERIENIIQPLIGFGGKPAETETESATRQVSRISNRHRAVTMKDYEQLVLEYFPEVDKVQCITVPQKQGASEVCLVVFSRVEDDRYYLSPAWKLAEIQRRIRPYAPPFVTLRVLNPVYESVDVRCKAVLWDSVQDEGKAIRQLVVLAQNYIAPWVRKKEIPAFRQSFSYKELHARMVNHEDLMRLVTLEVDGKSLPYVDIDTDDLTFTGKHPWSVLLPKIEIVLLSPHSGIDEVEIEGNFIIG